MVEEFLGLPMRPGKPRERGLTHVIDKGMTLAEIDGMFEIAGEYVDIVKLGWGTSYVTRNLAAKVRAVPVLRHAGDVRRDAARGGRRPRPRGRVPALDARATASPTSRCRTARCGWSARASRS